MGSYGASIDYFSPHEMSLNPGAEGKSLYDVLEGSVTSYFTRLAGVLQRNESVNGQYMTTTSSCYAGNTPVRVPGFARVCISTNGAAMVDVANSFITMNLKYTFRLSKPFTEAADEANTYPRKLFVGFKNSIEALQRYDIFVNSNQIYSQTWTGPESFIYNSGLCQTIKERCPYVHTCYDNAARMSPDVCGVYVDLTEYAIGTVPATLPEFTVDIPVKIPLQQILLLASVRYLPSFCGRWEIELYPNWNNIVVLPVHPMAYTTPQQWIDITSEDPAKWTKITQSFTQIGQPFTFMEEFSAGTAELIEDVKLTCSEGTMTQCLMNLTTFQLRHEVYEGLKQMYAEQPLIIPTNVLHYSRFSGEPGTGTQFHATLSQCLENCDSVFILVPNNNGQTTCFYQPYLRDVRLSLGEFGIHPANYVQTYDDPRFVAMALDALNLETSEITAMNYDLARSLTSPRPVKKVDSTAAGVHTYTDTWKIAPGDNSNFFIGISLSQVGFQSGTVSSPNTNIPFIFDAFVVPEDATTHFPKRPASGIPFETSIIAMFLLDAALIIQVVPGSDIPIVKLTAKSIV
jgi:hypothetical protein